MSGLHHKEFSMNKRKIFTLVGIGLLLILSMTQAFAYVRSTMAVYKNGVACGQELHGVPKLMQMAYFIAPSNCQAPVKGKCSNTDCTLPTASGKPAKTGKCMATGSEKNLTCTCQSN